jgi:hypothetical protein
MFEVAYDLHTMHEVKPNAQINTTHLDARLKLSTHNLIGLKMKRGG